MSVHFHPLRTLSMILVMAISSHAFGQLGGGRIDRPIDTPTFSPYLNMLRSSGGPTLNYFGLVRPQVDFAQQNQQMGQQLQMLQMQQTQGMGMPIRGYGYSQLGVTGHPVIFNSFGNGQFSGGYTSMNGGGFGGAGFSGGGMVGGGSGFGGAGYGSGAYGGAGGVYGGSSPFGGQMNVGGMGASAVSPGFSGVSGHAAQFGGIGNSSRGTLRGR
jgi:hypothetical protein